MNIILFDDEPLALDFLEHQLKIVRNVNIIGKYSHANINEISEKIKKSDVVFLDIKMPSLNGLKLAEKIAEIKPHLPIIFVTAYDKYALHAFELNALDYLLKPVQISRLRKTMDRIESYLQYNQVQKNENMHHLAINVLGEFTFQLHDDKEIIAWRTTNAQELFLYLLHHQGTIVSKSELIELLFPNLKVEKATSLLYVTIYQVRQAISKYNSYISVRNIQNGYILKLSDTSIDKEVWEQELNIAPAIDITTIEHHEQIMSYYNGSYLNGFDYIWVEGERYRLEKLWIKHAREIANYYMKHQYFEEAAKWFVKLSDVAPEDEEVNFNLMKIYASKGYGVLVDHQYNQLQNALAEFNLPLSDEVVEWYRRWKSSKSIKNKIK
ncbi:response regulator [Gracilibacillus massiliensis]|uniref:response regulator n=1 Tax=Gracilibacillus massiliensis TaxID=1564956 RepID=UPI00071D4980|nr:response regulator [Gracilibacillus massiliensis]